MASFVLAILLCFQPPPIVPVANFPGNVHGVSRKEITVESSGGNLVTFLLSKKTKAVRDGKAIRVADLETGDPVIVQARHEIDGALTAVRIEAQPKAAP